MNVFVAHFTAECNDHVTHDADLGAFNIRHGEEAIDALRVRDIFEETGFGIIPSIYAALPPAGVIAADAFATIEGEIISDLKAHLDEIDGIYLQLHGASDVRGLECVSGEHALLKRIREIVGEHMPIAVALDPHGNVTAELCSRVNIVRCFRESPHIDTVETWRLVAEKLVDLMLHRRPMHPVLRKLPIAVDGERSMSAYEPLRTINAMLDEAEQDPRVFSSSYHVGYMRHDDDKLGAAIVVVPNTPADRAWCEEIADRVAAYTWEHRDEFTFSGNFAEPADAVRDAVAFAGKTAVITDSGDNCGAGAAGHNTQMLRELLAADLMGKSVLVAGINDPAANEYLGTCKEGEHVSFDLGTGEDVYAEPVHIEGTLKVAGDAQVGSRNGWRVGPSYTASVDGTGVDVIVLNRNVQYGTMGQFTAAGVEFHDYDIVVVKMGYLDTFLIPETAYHTMALSGGATVQRCEDIQIRRMFRPMWPFDEMDELMLIESC